MEQTESDQRGGEEDNGRKKGKGLDKAHVGMTHGHLNQGFTERETSWVWVV